MNLYRRFDVDEETPVQFAAVYVTRWRPEWGEPTELFREAEEDDAESLAFARQLPEVRALVEAVCEGPWHSVTDCFAEDRTADCAVCIALRPFQEAE